MGVIPAKTPYGAGGRANVEGGAAIPDNDPYF